MAAMDEPVNSGPVSPVSIPQTLSTPFLGQPVEICIVTANMRETLSGLVRLYRGRGGLKLARRLSLVASRFGNGWRVR